MDNCTLYLLKFFCFASLIVTAKTGTCMTESGPRLELIRTPTSSSPVYPQQRVTVTCTTRESGIQVWRIDNYIVAGDTIEFLSRHLQETVITKTSIHDSEIIATLTCVDQENLILESTLSIVISPRPLTFNVTCVNNAWRIRDSITLHVLDMPAQEISSSLQGASACPGDRVNFTCTTYSSSILAWQSNYYLGKGVQAEFLSSDQKGKVISSDIKSSVFAILNSISMENGRIDITSTFSIIVPTDSRDDSRVIKCSNVNIGTKTTINFSLADDCSNDDSVTSQILPATVAINPSPDGPDSSDNGIIIAVIITVATSLLIITVILIMTIFLSSSLNRRRNKLLLKNQQAMSTLLQSNISFGSQVILRIDEMAPKWRQFGMAIGIDNSVLDGIDQEVHSQYGALQKVIDYWVRNSTKKLQWSDVFIAVNTVKQENNSESCPSEVGPISLTSEEEFGADNITVTVEWTQEEGATYQITIVPEIPMTSTGESSIQLILSYNINYNLSVKSALPCQHQAYGHILLFYANCGYPLLSANNTSKPNVTYSGLPLQGATITFTCPTDLVLNGSNTATCMENGEWEPDPQNVTCIEVTVVDCGHPMIDELIRVVGYNDENDLPTEQGTTINLTCPPAMSFTGQNSITCMNGVWEPDPTSILCKKGPDNGSSTTVIIVAISVSLVISILIIISTCVIVILVNLKRKGVPKQPSSCNVLLSSVEQRNERSSNNNDLPNLQDEPDYSVLQHSHGHGQLGSQKPTSVTRMDEGDASNIPDVLHGLYADVVVTPKKKHPSMLSAPDLDNSRVAYAQVEHKLNNDKASDIPNSDQIHNADLQINLDNLLIQLKGQVSSKWYQFGEAAGIDKRVLDNYVKNCSPDECIIEMFDYWLRSYKGKMTWRYVAAILRSINLQQLAYDIEQVYVTGKLPVESESDGIPQSFSVVKPGAKVSSEIEVPPPIPPKLLEHDIWAPSDQDGQTNNEPAYKLPPRPPKTKPSIITTAGSSAPARPPKPPYT